MKSLGKVVILGDSYSTYEGWVPDGFLYYYDDIRTKGVDVDHVEQTWWHMLIHETEAQLLLNSSYSGTTICNTGYDGENCSHKSFISRLDRLIEDGYFEQNKIDTILVFGGTNDFWAKSPIGNLKYSNWEEEDLREFLPAFCYMLDRIKNKISSVRPIVLINCSDTRPVMLEGMITACKKYCVEYIEIVNIDKGGGHPSALGMKQIKDQIVDYLEQTPDF